MKLLSTSDADGYSSTEAKSGRNQTYRAACARILSVAGSNPPPNIANTAAWNCCLSPEAVPDQAVLVTFAETAEKTYPRDGAVFNTLGGTLLRGGRPADAIGKLEESMHLVGPKDETVHNELLLAMAHHRLAHEHEAHRWLDAAATKIDRHRAPATACGTAGVCHLGGLPVAASVLAKCPDPRAVKDDNSLCNWLEMDILRAEAEAALASAQSRR
jgi:hypothetical protein